MAELIWLLTIAFIKVSTLCVKVLIYTVAVIVMVPYFIIMFIIHLARKDDSNDILTRRPHPRAAGRTRIAPLVDH